MSGVESNNDNCNNTDMMVIVEKLVQVRQGKKYMIPGYYKG